MIDHPIATLRSIRQNFRLLILQHICFANTTNAENRLSAVWLVFISLIIQPRFPAERNGPSSQIKRASLQPSAELRLGT